MHRPPTERARPFPMTPPPPPPPQSLWRARARASGGRMLPDAEAGGTYGDRFWQEVAGGVPGRTMAQCLDGYVASHCSTVARFSGGGRRIG
jgi:hypothetical protein